MASCCAIGRSCSDAENALFSRSVRGSILGTATCTRLFGSADRPLTRLAETTIFLFETLEALGGLEILEVFEVLDALEEKDVVFLTELRLPPAAVLLLCVARALCAALLLEAAALLGESDAV